MHKQKSVSNYKLIFAILVAFVALMYSSIFVKASDKYQFIVTAVSADGQSIESSSKTIGGAVNWNGTEYIFSDLPDEKYYAYNDSSDEKFIIMNECDNPTGIDDGLGWYTPSESLSDTPASVVQGSIGETYVLVYLDSAGSIQNTDFVINKYEKYGNIYEVTEGKWDDTIEGYYPMALCDSTGNYIGYFPRKDWVLLFEEPTGGDSSGSGSSDDGSSDDGSSDDGSSDDGSSNSGSSYGNFSDYDGDSSESGLFSSTTIRIILVAILCGIAIVIIILIRKKNNSPVKPDLEPKPNKPLKPAESVEPSKPIEATKPVVPQGPEEIIRPIKSINWFIKVNGFEYSVEGSLLIGRNPECDIRFPENTKGVSRHHCRIFIDNNQLFVMDLGSSYGTYLENYTKLTANKPQNIRQGEIIYLGGRENIVSIICK